MKPYDPAKLSMGIIVAPLELGSAAVKSQLEKVIGPRSFALKSEFVNWREFFMQDGLFIDGKLFQIALFSPHKDITVYACNLADGWVSLYENIIKAHAFDAYFFRTTLSSVLKYRVFEMIAWKCGAAIRQVRALQDDRGWEFLSRGDILPFEDAERYKKRKNEHLDCILIETYSKNTGFEISSLTGFRERVIHFFSCDL
jgi:hypothetical protein